MSSFVHIDHIDQVFPLPGGGEYIALKNINLQIKKGEFVTLLGHSGCGKSTLLNIVAGLAKPAAGGVVLEGRQVTKPGPDRMVVFQNYSLLPWLTVRQNIALAVNRVLRDKPESERQAIVEEHIDLVHLRHAADKRPGQLSGGMKQRVAIARALALRPKVLLLDEPFGALDALTRSGLQDQLMQIAQQNELTCIMVTHDVEEALLLSDRIVMLTNGPESHIGQILEVPFERPRERLAVLGHPSFYGLRNEVNYFLNQQKRAKQRQVIPVIAGNGLEKINLEIGFIPLTDCAPLAVAKEKGFFQMHGLEQVTLSREPGWKAIADGIMSGRLDAAQMVAGMPLALSLGMKGMQPTPIVTGMVLSRNGNAITLSKRFYNEGVRSLADLKAAIDRNRDKVLTLAVVHPASMHNLMLRHWLASGGIDPNQDVNIVMIPPAQMVSALKTGAIDGYCAGEPWNSRAVQEGLGFVIATDLDIWSGHLEKVLGVREDWANRYPQTHIALVKALLEACEYCDDRRNREEIAEILARPEYIGVSVDYIRPGLVTPYDRGMGEAPSSLLRYNQFYVDRTNCPYRVEGLWVMTQLARWGITPFPRNWVDVLERTRRVDVFGAAARDLGMLDIEPNRRPVTLSDGTVFNPDDPIGYLNSLTIKQNIRIEEVNLDQVPVTP
ncbi:nitrate ABC transporter ATP-binding protein [Leptolyngbya sp. FACHB-711]|uniref:ABC transporter ATP-binding/substrate-binding protein n=1 Tax=unclassified Leptolyngbya TaxID=2650499 RepID=UPI0016840137|nr:nitrate ABC transporter ATP-binding protein [Leptolyngbya sp. FACHB-711]MBD1851534.1 ABC transporter substrate-binding protein [Cyanobacteria bacterium FACHB-502]MBD2025854.1 ABC transporter substrate-binding protein [Leptolyngbya sp. FACHB-711]